MNIFQNIIEDYQNENFDTLLDLPNIRIERIVSNGQSSENNFWYDQDENEWILLIKGDAELEYKTGEIIQLEKDTFEWTNIKQEIRDTLNQYLFQKTKCIG